MADHMDDVESRLHAAGLPVLASLSALVRRLDGTTVTVGVTADASHVEAVVDRRLAERDREAEVAERMEWR